MRKSPFVFVIGVLGAGAFAGCFGSQGSVSVTDTPDEGIDAAAQGDDASGDVSAPDAATEAGADTGPDATVTPEASGPSPEAEPDQTVAEASPEASPDVALEAAPEPQPEAAAPEAGPDATTDASDASADSGPEAAADAPTDASDAAAFCVAQIFGDHYVRPDGELIYGPAGAHTVVVASSTSTPLLGITEIVQQPDHACGLRSDGTVWCWALSTSGGNANGDLGNGTFGGTNLGVGVATQVVTNAADAGAPAYLTNVVHLSTASDTFYSFPTCAIRADKTVWCWGYSTAETGANDGLFWGTTGSVAAIPYALPIAAGPADGGPPPTLTADQVSVGLRHACVVLAGKVSCWGQNVAGNLANGDVSLAFKPYPLPVVTGYGLPATVDAVGCGSDFTCALGGGSVWCWGTTAANQIGNPSVPNAICNSNYCDPQPTPVQASAPDGGATQVPDAGPDQNPLVNIGSLVVGYQFACGLDTSGRIWCWGAYVAGSMYVTTAVPYTSTTAPYTNVTRISAWGEGVSDGLRYTTASGAYVSAGQVHAPFCL